MEKKNFVQRILEDNGENFLSQDQVFYTLTKDYDPFETGNKPMEQPLEYGEVALIEAEKLAKRCLTGERVELTPGIAELLLLLIGSARREISGGRRFQGFSVIPEREDMDIRGDVLVKYKGNATDIIVPEGIHIIGPSAFEGNQRLVSVYLPYSLQEMGAYAFAGCGELATVTIQRKLEEISDYAFADCQKLKDIIFVDSLMRKIGAFAFSNCHGLQEICLPDQLQVIGQGAFLNCINLQKVSATMTLVRIESRAFAECNALESIHNLSPQVQIDKQAFEHCYSLNRVKRMEIRCWNARGGNSDLEVPTSQHKEV